MKRVALLACVAVFVAVLAGCSGNYSNTTLTGKVTEIDGTTVTLQLGEISGSTSEGSGEDSDTGGDTNGAPSEDMGDASGMPGGNNTSDMPGGGNDEGGMPGGGSDMGGGMPGGMGGSSSETFVESDQTAVVNLDKAESVTSELLTGEDKTIDVYDIAVDDILVIVFGNGNSIESVTVKNIGGGNESGGMGGMPGGGSGGMPGGQDGGGNMPGGGSGGQGGDTVSQGTAANTIDKDGTYNGETYTSTGDNENALRVTDATVTLDSITVDKSAGSSSDADSGDFYGANAALLVTDSAEATITNATVESNAQHGNGVFSYGEGTVVNISDSTITTSSDGSGGLQTTGGGTMNATNLTIETQGSSSAAIRSDRGGGTVNVDHGSYTSNGHNSPAIYSTADITVSNATLTATGSEAFVIEGKNSITLKNCESEGNMSSTQGASSDENVHNVMIYQSMSGDADVGRSAFEMRDGSLTSNNGDMFYITNTQCTVKLSNVEITNKDTDAYLFRVSGNSGSRGWGSAGSNGGDAEVTLDNQTLEGDIVVDSISKLDMTFENGSKLTGSINIVDNAQRGTAVSDNAVITVKSGCTWTLTDDCTITSLDNNGTIDYNGHTITLADGTVLQ